VGKETAISWCDATWNLAWGCEKTSPGCAKCYALAFDKRTGGDHWGPGAPRRTFGPRYWRQPLAWDREAALAGERRRVFCSSMTDVFLDDPVIDHERAKLWPLIRQTRLGLDWLLLTKRANRIRQCLPADWGDGYGNVWMGVSVEDQERALERIPILLAIPAAIRFLSVEPLLGPVDLSPWLPGLSWVIVGGESGPGFRPMDLEWVRTLRDQCRWYGVAFWFKQGAGLRPGTGVELDGRIHHEVPAVGGR